MTSAIKKFETGEIGHWEIQADTGELFWSDEIYRIHGLDVGGEIDVEAAIQAYHPDDREKVGEYVRRALEEKEDYQFEFRLVRPSGEIRDVKSTGVVRLHPDGEVRSVFGVFQDITVSVKQKRDLEEKSRMLQQAEKLAKFGHWEIQADSGELYWSDEIYRIHGMEVGSEIDVDAAINAYHPDDREMVGEYVRRALEEKKDYQFELRVLKPGGDIQYVKSTGTVHLKPNGDVQSVFGVFQDINDLKKAEDAKSKNAALVNALVEHSPFPVTIKDLEGRYKLVSPAFSRFFNNPTGKIIGNKLGDLLSDETVEILESADQEVVNTGNPVTLDHTFPVELGSNTLQVSKFPITDIDGAVSGIGTVALDISEITEAQKALKHHRDLLEKTVDERTKELLHSEEKYRSIFNNAQVGIGRTRFSDGKVLEANAKLASMFGCDNVDDFISNFKFSDKYVDPAGRKKSLYAYENFPGEVHEILFYRNDGSIIRVSSHGRVNREENCIEVLAVDITERKKAEDRLKLFLENVHEGIFIVREGKIIDASNTVATMLGYTLDEVIGMSPMDFVPANLRKLVARQISENVADAYESKILKKDGSTIPVLVKGKAMNLAGEEIRISTVLDISEIKKAEQKIRNLSHALEQSPSVVFITDVDGCIEYINPTFSKICGYSIDEAVGRSLNLLKSDETLDQEYEVIWGNLKSGDEWRGELQDQRKDGTTFWAYATFSPVKDMKGEITHFVSMHEDITQRKEVEILEYQAREQAEMASRAKSELLANMSHELRTPLNAIIGFSEAFQEQLFGELGSEKYIEYAADINHSGQHLLTLINDILDVSAIESGKMKLNEGYISLPNVVDASIRMIRQRAEEGDIELKTTIPENIRGLFGDERRIKQVLLNLLSNAVKFTLPGGRVSVAAELNSINEIILRVSDSGIGMNEKELAKAIEQFGQVDSTLARKHDGSGLGLPLTMGLVHLHGGTLELESTKGEGTTATVRFSQERTVEK